MPNKYQKIMEMLGACPILGTKLPPGPISEEEFDSHQTEIGYVLPADFREFMRDYWGYHFAAEYPLIEEGRPSVRCIDGFCGRNIALTYFSTIESLEDGSDNRECYPSLSLIRNLSDETEEIKWPHELLPIGYDGGGNEICLALFGLRAGAIFYWRANPHSNSENFYLIANSFDEFMHLLRKSE